MNKAYRYRIYPTKKQARMFLQTLDICREIYNAGLAERRDAYKLAGKSVTYTQQQNQLPAIKKLREDLDTVYSQVLQDALRRLDNAFQGFFDRLKKGEKPGYPRFRGRDRYDSFCYPQADNGSVKIVGGKLVLSKIGHIKMVQHRALEGVIKTCRIKRTASGKWFASITCEVEAKPLPPNDQAVGGDFGITTFLTLSDGDKVPSPEFFREEEKELAKEQRTLCAAPKGSKERKLAKHTVALVHERIANKRENFAHHVSATLVLLFGAIFLEDLSIRNMVKNHCLAKSIMDAAWNQTAKFTHYKAVYAGRKFKLVDPRNTTQMCSGCKMIVPKTLSDRVHSCPHCGLVLCRDVNAARNILSLGLQTVG